MDEELSFEEEILSLYKKKKEIDDQLELLEYTLKDYIRKYVDKLVKMNEWCKENIPRNKFSYKDYVYHDFYDLDYHRYSIEKIEYDYNDDLSIRLESYDRCGSYDSHIFNIPLSFLLNPKAQDELIEKAKIPLLEKKQKDEEEAKQKILKDKVELYQKLKKELEGEDQGNTVDF